MSKPMSAVVLFIILSLLHNEAFADSLKCKFKNEPMEGVTSVEISDDFLTINSDLEIPLEETKIKCGRTVKVSRLDGQALGYQVILKSCATTSMFEGHLFDHVKQKESEIKCD